MTVQLGNAHCHTVLLLVESADSNGTGQCNFSGQRDRSSFIVPGQGTPGQAQNLAMGQDVPEQSVKI